MLSFFVCFLLCFTIYGFIPTYSTRIYIRIAIKSYSFKSSVNTLPYSVRVLSLIAIDSLLIQYQSRRTLAWRMRMVS